MELGIWEKRIFVPQVVKRAGQGKRDGRKENGQYDDGTLRQERVNDPSLPMEELSYTGQLARGMISSELIIWKQGLTEKQQMSICLLFKWKGSAGS